MARPTHICRECGAELPARTKAYRVVRSDGDYPGTRLCPSCLEEYRHDADVLSVEEER